MQRGVYETNCGGRERVAEQRVRYKRNKRYEKGGGLKIKGGQSVQPRYLEALRYFTFSYLRP